MATIIHEFQMEIDDFKISEADRISEEVKTTGQILPQIGILYYCPHNKKPITMTLPIPTMAMENNAMKDHLADYVLPKIFEFFKRAERTIICICFVSEAWMWIVSKEENIKISERMTLKEQAILKQNRAREEIILLSFETEFSCVPVMYKKVGEQRNSMGEATGKIHLEIMDGPFEQPSGRFLSLFRRQNKKN